MPSGNGYAAHLEIDLSGKGWLVGDVDAAGMATRLQDELVVLPQTVALDAKIRMQRAPSGYEVDGHGVAETDRGGDPEPPHQRDAQLVRGARPLLGVRLRWRGARAAHGRDSLAGERG